MSSPPPAVRFSAPVIHRTGVHEQSGLTWLSPAKGFVVVDDETGALWGVSRPSGAEVEVSRLTEPREVLRGLEGVTYDPDTDRVLVVAEERRRVFELAVVEGAVVGAPEALGKLPKWNKKKNKRWEGLAILPADRSPDGVTRLLAVHEDRPSAVGVFDRHDLSLVAKLDLPKMKPAPSDLSDLAVDPVTGHLFLLSDEDRGVYEVRLARRAAPRAEDARWSMAFVGYTELPDVEVDEDRLQPEGAAFDHLGDLWVACEGGQLLMHLPRA